MAIFSDGGCRHNRAKFRGDRWNRCRDTAIFQFFKMEAAAVLNFYIFEILTVGTCSQQGRIVSSFQMSWRSAQLSNQRDFIYLVNILLFICSLSLTSLNFAVKQRRPIDHQASTQ